MTYIVLFLRTKYVLHGFSPLNKSTVERNSKFQCMFGISFLCVPLLISYILDYDLKTVHKIGTNNEYM